MSSKEAMQDVIQVELIPQESDQYSQTWRKQTQICHVIELYIHGTVK